MGLAKDIQAISKRRAWGFLAQYIMLRLAGVVITVLTIPIWLPAIAVILFSEAVQWIWKNALKPVCVVLMWPVTMGFKVYERWEKDLIIRFNDKHLARNSTEGE